MLRTKFIFITIFFLILLSNVQTGYAQDSSKTIDTLEITTIDEPHPEMITASDIFNDYLEAIGGRTLFAGVKDRTTIMRGEMMGQKLSIVIKQKYPNKLRQEFQSGAMKQTVIFDGTNAIMIIGEQTVDIEGSELSKLKTEAQMDFLLAPETYGVTPELQGTEIIDSVECYKIVMNTEDGKSWLQFYSAETGLKVKEIKDVETPQGTFRQETVFSDYKEVDGLLFPFKIKQSFGMQSIDMNISSIKINTGLEDKLFEIPE